MLKIATDTTYNGLLDREAFLLSRLREHAQDLEKEFSTIYPGKCLNYHLAFPHMRESFLSAEQGGRKVLILEVEAVKDMESLVSLSMIRTRDCVRVDHKTAAWMLGKSLKILAFAHDYSVSFGPISGDDIVVEREGHMVVFLDWLNATRVSGGVTLSREVISKELYLLAREIVLVLGGDPITFTTPHSEDDPDGLFQEFLRKLSRGGFTKAHIAHRDFYQMVEGMWGITFHPYTTLPL
jgi:hypothetical protein